MQDTFDLHKWKTYQMFLNESDDDFEFTDTDKDLAMGLSIIELTVGDTITPDMWNEQFYKEFQDINQTIERIKYDGADDGAEEWTDAHGWIVLFKDKRTSPGGFYLDDLNGFLKSNYKIVLPDNLDEQDDDFEFTDIDKDLANKLNKELKVGSVITPNMWDKETLERAIDYFIAADSSDLAEKYKELLKKPHKISGLFKSELIPNSEDYYKIVFTNGTNIHSSNLEPEFNVFESLQENDDFEFTDADKDLAMGLGIIELTIGDTIMPDMWIDVFKKGETLKKYEIKSLKSSPHKITNIEVIGDDRVLMFGEIDNYYYTNDFLKPQYRVVLPDDLDEINEAWTKGRRGRGISVDYAKHLDYQNQAKKKSIEKLKQDPEAWAEYLEKQSQAAKQSLEKLKQDPEAYAKWLETKRQRSKQSIEKLKQDPEAYAKYLEKAKQARDNNPEKVKQAKKQRYEKLKQDPEAYAKYLEKSKQAAKQYYYKKNSGKQNQEKAKKQRYEKLKQDPEAYAKYLDYQKQYAKQNKEKLKQDPEAWAKYLEKQKQYNEPNREKIKQDPEAYAKHLDYQKQYAKQNREKTKQDYDNYVKQSSDFFYNTLTNNLSPELKNIKSNPKLLTKLYSDFIKKAKQQYKIKNKDFSFMITESDDFEFTDIDKKLAASMYADKIVSKYDVIIDIDQEVDVRLKKPLTDDFILKLLKRPLSLEYTSIECTISVSNRMALSDLLNYLNISEDVYSQWITPNLELDAGLAEENLNDLVDETISTHVHSLWDDNFEEGDFQINNVVIDYSEMPDDVLKLAKSDAFRKALNKSVIEQIMSPDFYSRGQENIFADYVHYDWDVRVVPNTLNEADDFEFTDILNEAWSEERKKQDPEGYAKHLKALKSNKQSKEKYLEKLKQDPEAYAKYLEKKNQDIKQYREKLKQDPEARAKYLEKAKQRSKQYLEKLKQDPEAYAKRLEKLKQYSKQNYEKNPEKAKQYLEKLKQDPEVYAKYLEKAKQYREKLKQDPETYAKYLEKLKQYREKNPEKAKQYLEKLKQDPEARAKYLEKIKQYSNQYYEKLKQDPEAYAKHLEKSKQSAKQYQEKNPEKIKQYSKQYYEKNLEKVKQYANQYYEKNLEKVKQRLKQDYEKLKQDPEAYAKWLEKNRQKTKQNYEKIKQDYDNYVKKSSDFFYNTITNNPSPELKNIKDNPKLLTKLYSDFIKKAKQRYKAKNKDFSFMITESDDFEFTDADKDLASSLADDVILEPGYVFTGDEIKDDKALRARLTGKTIARYYTRKSPLLNSSDQIMMDIKDVSGKEIQYVLSKLKPNYFIPDEVYDLKLGEEYK